MTDAVSSHPAEPLSRNRISPIRFIVRFGVVSGLADVVYEGARSIIGPFLGVLGASAAAVGLITGVGEAAALVLRLFTGRISDRTGRPWPQTIAGYALTVVCVPLIGLTGGTYNFISNLSGISTPLIIGYLAANGNFAPGLIYIAVVAVMGALSYILLIGKLERVE